MKKNLFLLLSALMLVITGCSTDYEILKSVESVNLLTDSSTKAAGQPIEFSVTNTAGEDVTSESTIYIDGVAIEGNTYTSAVVGTFEAKASYDGNESQPVLITFHDGTEINFIKRVLIEDYTGTWCGYCPRVAHAIEEVKHQTDKVVAVGIHRPSSAVASPVYDPYNYDTSELENTLTNPLGEPVTGYPKGFLNRRTQWASPEPENTSQAIALTQGLNPKLGLAMTSTVNGGTIDLEVRTKFGKNFSNLKLVVYVLENGLIYDQHNYTEYYNDADIIEDFEHNHVLRAVLTPLLGEAMSSTETYIENIYTRTFSVPVPANVANAANLEFVAFIVDENGNAINVRKAEPGEIQEFEEI